ncbi:helix-turn-helix domain-containing protein [Aerococcus viridans]
MDNHKGYYAVIPADVRYDEKLIPNAKLLYGEITALTNDKGYCWATNSYFANLYGVTTKTISNWLSSLEKQGYIYREVERDEKKVVTSRKIFLGGMKESSHPSGRKVPTPPEEKVKENNTFNNTSNNTKNKGKTPTKHKYGEFKNVLLTDDELEKLKNKYPNDLNQRIERLSDYVASTGKGYKSHYATIISWANRDKSKKPQNDTFQNTRNSQEDTEITPEMMKAYEELKQNERA